MNKYDCKYKMLVETDYDIISGHSYYESQCTRKEKYKETCLDCYCKYREYPEDKPSSSNGKDKKLLIS